jgi:hypothetical protein
MECVGDEICIATQDLIVALDSSGSLRESGFETLREFTVNLTGRYTGEYYGRSKMQVGAALFGNGRVLEDGTIAPAINIIGLTADMSAVRSAIEETTWQKGLTNMAQVFTLAEVMLSQGGRPEAQSAVLVLSDGKYSFAFSTAQQVEKLKDASVQVFMAAISDQKDEGLKMIKEWASQPWQTNYERIPGLLALEFNMDSFAGKLVAKFCSKSISPSIQMQKAEDLEYMMIHESGYPSDECGKWKWYGKGYTIEECMEQARADEYGGFAYAMPGTLAATGCYTEAIEVDDELWQAWETDPRAPPCPGGEWVSNPYFDTYAIKPVEPMPEK